MPFADTSGTGCGSGAFVSSGIGCDGVDGMDVAGEDADADIPGSFESASDIVNRAGSSLATSASPSVISFSPFPSPFLT